MKATTKALVHHYSGWSSYGICNAIACCTDGTTDIGHLHRETICITERLGIFSGDRMYPIAADGQHPAIAYERARDAQALWSKHTEYGRRRRRVFVELLKYVERSPEFD